MSLIDCDTDMGWLTHREAIYSLLNRDRLSASFSVVEVEARMTRGLRFTLADDDDKFLFILQHLLMQDFPGCSFAAFTNAEDALQHILNSGTDLLVTNHGMGRMSGTELIQELRRKKSSIPIIMMSGNQKAEKEAIDAGANEFLHKDLVLSHLADRVKHYIFG